MTKRQKQKLQHFSPLNQKTATATSGKEMLGFLIIGFYLPFHALNIIFAQ